MKEVIEKVVEQLALGDPEAVESIRQLAGEFAVHVPGLTDALVEVLRPLGEHAELAHARAKSSMILFQAYVDVGFTEDQAMALLVNAKEGLQRSLVQGAANAGALS